MSQHPRQQTFSAACGGVRMTHRPHPPPALSDLPIVLALQGFRPPPQNMIHGRRHAYQYQNYYQDSSPYGHGGNSDSYNRDRAPSFTPPTRSENRYQNQITNLEMYDVVRMQRGGYVQEDETWIFDGTGHETEDTMMLGDGCLSEEVVTKYLKIKNSPEVVANNRDEGPKICVVCQDNLHQENGMIGVLECGHEYHACCIKKWLQRKNICPLCKATALPVDGLQNQER